MVKIYTYREWLREQCGQRKDTELHSRYSAKTEETGRNEFGNATRAQVVEG